MPQSVKMPELGESITEGTVVQWLKQEGDKVAVDEPLLEISTDKVDTEIPSPIAGTLTKILVEVDQVVAVGSDIALISPENETSSDSSNTPEDSKVEQEDTNLTSTTGESNKVTAVESPQDSDGQDLNEIIMPELGESITEGTITRWLKHEGDEVAVDEPIVEVSTDKVDTEIPSLYAGKLLKVYAQEDDVVSVGAPLAKIGTISPAETPEVNPKTSENSSTTIVDNSKNKETTSPSHSRDTSIADNGNSPITNTSTITPPSTHSTQTYPYVTPLVRKIAQDNSIDLQHVKGSGVGGRIRKQDVLAIIEAKSATDKVSGTLNAPTKPQLLNYSDLPGVRSELAELRGTTTKFNKIREITAKKTRESLQISAQLTQTFEIDLTEMVKLRTSLKPIIAEKYGFNLTYLHLIAFATVKVLEQHPNINASINEETKEITYHGEVNLGIAVDTPEGLLSPVIHKADSLSLLELAQALVDLAKRSRANELKPNELFGGTFTITNIGTQGALFDTPILVPPQAGMLGTGNIVKRPMIITDAHGNDSIAIRSMMYTPLTYDHRLVDGADAGRFLSSLKYLLERPSFIENELST